MPMGEFHYPLWQEPLQQAIDEPDLQELGEKLSAAKPRYFCHIQELKISPVGELSFDNANSSKGG